MPPNRAARRRLMRQMGRRRSDAKKPGRRGYVRRTLVARVDPFKVFGLPFGFYIGRYREKSAVMEKKADGVL